MKLAQSWSISTTKRILFRPMEEEKAFRFKEAVKELETIVRELEDDTVDLDVALKKYERGIRLIRMCNEYLDKAELRLKELTQDEGGAPLLKDAQLEE